MTSSITEIFDDCRIDRRTAIMPFLTAGYPDEKMFVRLLKGIMNAGADLIEIGIPFSDPLADGKSIQYSSQIALAGGINMKKVLNLLDGISETHNVPLVLMSYYNPIHQFNPSRLARMAFKAGVRGLIIPDLIPEEGKTMEAICTDQTIDLVYLLAPTSTPERRTRIIRHSRGFVYLVSVAGVTGARQQLPRRLNAWISQVKKESHLPVCVGFGISDAKQAQKISRVADGIIIGSALVEIIRRANGSHRMVSDVQRFISRLRERI